ncbi:hypothetical protein B0T17DRAFT_531019 [Bombardia bombarda]|uniref:Uncharacterized protein n=1 Tax=Bombardia bombarda TaxID=252184 RepID=A0AA39X012_9PEZI|nr:hypothetical protein B0T17DRAFT_531019 [Bombardia bombarda]
MKLHDLTKRDIAEGVFLCVVLVLCSLEDGLSNHDSLRVLTNRVKSAPNQLNKLFSAILDSIDVHYRRSTYYLFALTLRMNGVLLASETRDSRFTHLDNFTKFAEESFQCLSALGCSLFICAVDEEKPMNRNTTPERAKSEEEILERCRKALSQIKAGLKGFWMLIKMAM